MANEVSGTLDRFQMKVRSLCLDEASSSYNNASGPWWKAKQVIDIKQVVLWKVLISLQTFP